MNNVLVLDRGNGRTVVINFNNAVAWHTDDDGLTHIECTNNIVYKVNDSTDEINALLSVVTYV